MSGKYEPQKQEFESASTGEDMRRDDSLPREFNGQQADRPALASIWKGNPMDVRAFNREAWNRLVDTGDQWTIPVSSEAIAKARVGERMVVTSPKAGHLLVVTRASFRCSHSGESTWLKHLMKQSPAQNSS
ncbi:MAG: hypothetical protein H6822_12370 [Planctomycetaceae bacterium]|nr:hypothetical protein [Planctomycetales bacterium]MCB9922972.1 hypothetical protein [Planctomycetaceae bacterium]